MFTQTWPWVAPAAGVAAVAGAELVFAFDEFVDVSAAFVLVFGCLTGLAAAEDAGDLLVAAEGEGDALVSAFLLVCFGEAEALADGVGDCAWTKAALVSAMMSVRMSRFITRESFQGRRLDAGKPFAMR